MDLVGIIHVVDTLSSGRHGFNFIYVVGLIQFIFLLCLSNVHILVELLSHK